MSEQRFQLRKYHNRWEIYDEETVECYTIHQISGLLNEQQATIIKQEQKIKHLREVLTEIYVMSVQESIISEERSENDE